MPTGLSTFYLKSELHLNLMCGKTMCIKGTDSQRHKNFYRIHQKKCDVCRSIKFDAIQNYYDEELHRQQAQLRSMRQGSNATGTNKTAFDIETGQSLTQEEVEDIKQQDKDARWLINMALRCIEKSDEETKKIDAYLCENFGANWKATVLFEAVKNVNI